MATHANINRKEDTQMTKETQQADGLTSHLTQELGICGQKKELNYFT